MNVPESLQQAVQFSVDPRVSVWAMDILKHNGWELVTYNPNSSIEVSIDI